jgi:hypothetical protein
MGRLQLFQPFNSKQFPDRSLGFPEQISTSFVVCSSLAKNRRGRWGQGVTWLVTRVARASLPARQAGFQPAHFSMSSGLEGRMPRRLEAYVTSALKGSLNSLKMFNL